jgi:hypothetical protein
MKSMEIGIFTNRDRHHADPRPGETEFSRTNFRTSSSYVWRTFFWPGKRLRYDGTPYVLPPAAADESWIPLPEESLDDLGAMYPAQ